MHAAVDFPNDRARVLQNLQMARDGIYSIAKFELNPAGGGTMLVFDQAGFPEAEGEHLEQGWHKMYWEPLRRYLEQPA